MKGQIYGAAILFGVLLYAGLQLILMKAPVIGPVVGNQMELALLAFYVFVVSGVTAETWSKYEAHMLKGVTSLSKMFLRTLALDLLVYTVLLYTGLTLFHQAADPANDDVLLLYGLGGGFIGFCGVFFTPHITDFFIGRVLRDQDFRQSIQRTEEDTRTGNRPMRRD